MLLTVTIYNNRNERGKATSPDNREDTGRNRGQCQWSGGPGPEDTHTLTLLGHCRTHGQQQLFSVRLSDADINGQSRFSFPSQTFNQ